MKLRANCPKWAAYTRLQEQNTPVASLREWHTGLSGTIKSTGGTLQDNHAKGFLGYYSYYGSAGPKSDK